MAIEFGKLVVAIVIGRFMSKFRINRPITPLACDKADHRSDRQCLFFFHKLPIPFSGRLQKCQSLLHHKEYHSDAQMHPSTRIIPLFNDALGP